MKTGKLLIAIAALFEMYVLRLWVVCQKFADSFHFSAFDTRLKIEDGVHNDRGYSSIARLFHNKLDISLFEIFARYIQFWDFRFEVLFLSIVGVFGLVCGFWYTAVEKKKKPKIKLFLLILVLLPFIEVFQFPLPFWIRFTILSLPYVLFSLYGLWQFIKHHKRWGKICVLVLLLISLWYIIVFQKDILGSFCYN